MILETYIEDDGGKELAVTVHYNYHTGCKGARDSCGGVRGAGPPLEPDDPPEVEIERVVGRDGKELELADDVLEALRELCFEAVAAADAEWAGD